MVYFMKLFPNWGEGFKSIGKIWLMDFKLFTFVETSYLNTDMRKFESSQKEESRAQTADSSKACSKTRAFNANFAFWLI